MFLSLMVPSAAFWRNILLSTAPKVFWRIQIKKASQSLENTGFAT